MSLLLLFIDSIKRRLVSRHVTYTGVVVVKIRGVYVKTFITPITPDVITDARLTVNASADTGQITPRGEGAVRKLVISRGRVSRPIITQAIVEGIDNNVGVSNASPINPACDVDTLPSQIAQGDVLAPVGVGIDPTPSVLADTITIPLLPLGKDLHSARKDEEEFIITLLEAA